MSARLWKTNAPALIQEFAESRRLVAEDVVRLLSFARRLEIDPFDIAAARDHSGEHYCRIGPSATIAGRALAAGYRIDVPRRSVEVISFALD